MVIIINAITRSYPPPTPFNQQHKELNNTAFALEQNNYEPSSSPKRILMII